MHSLSVFTTRSPSFRIRMVRPPPIPAMTALSASPGSMAEKPSDSRVLIRSESPCSRIFSSARSSGPRFTSMAMA